MFSPAKGHNAVPQRGLKRDIVVHVGQGTARTIVLNDVEDFPIAAGLQGLGLDLILRHTLQEAGPVPCQTSFFVARPINDSQMHGPRAIARTPGHRLIVVTKAIDGRHPVLLGRDPSRRVEHDSAEDPFADRIHGCGRTAVAAIDDVTKIVVVPRVVHPMHLGQGVGRRDIDVADLRHIGSVGCHGPNFHVAFMDMNAIGGDLLDAVPHLAQTRPQGVFVASAIGRVGQLKQGFPIAHA